MKVGTHMKVRTHMSSPGGVAHVGVAVPPCRLQILLWCPGCCCCITASLSCSATACDGDTPSHWRMCKGPLAQVPGAPIVTQTEAGQHQTRTFRGK